jgi:hypothetical protein
MTKSSGMILNSSAGPERVSIMDDTNNRLPVMRIRKIKSLVDFGREDILPKRCWMKELWPPV